ncbi:efflux RND transporter permease subunit, partial [Candidatus Dependentiae bacterium]|nr:efflux RND transporter permease subunit [Candidatus Dependentiae bacterium]
MKIIEVAVKNSTAVFVFIFVLLILGIVSYKNLPLESAPEVKIPLLIVNTFYFGVAPADIESLITNRIERELKSLDKIKKITSVSMEGLSSIKVEFIPGIDLDVARQKVKDKVDLAKPELPDDAEDPMIEEINFSEFPIMYVSLFGKNLGLYNLKNISEDLKDKIKLIKGVLDVEISGGLEREVQVNVDPAKLRYYQVSLEEIINKIRMENITMPGGSIEIGQFNYSVRIPGEIESPDDMADWIISEKDNMPVYLKDVAVMSYKYKEIKSVSRLDGQEAVTLSIKKRTGENIVFIADAVKKLLADEMKILPKTLNYVILGDQSKEIKMMVDDLENNIITSLILVVGVLFFAMNFRNSLFVGIAIPFSMLLSFIIIDFLGITLNMIVLFSLILALGMLVDNAIVLVDNIYRYMQLGKNKIEAAILGAKEIAWPITTSTLTTLAAFGPLIFWPGVVGDFMSYLPKTVIIILSASLLVALTINPVICAALMKVDKKVIRSDKTKIKKHNFLYNFYRRVLLWALGHRWLTLTGMILMFILTIIIYGKFGKPIIFFPDVDPQQVMITLKFPVGTKLEHTDLFSREIENIILNTPDSQHYVTNVGVEGREETHKAQIQIDLKDLLDRTQNSNKTLNQVRDMIKPIPGAELEVSKPQHGPPTGASITIEIIGEDFKELSKLTDKIKKEIQTIPGLINLRDDLEEEKPEIKIMVDRDRASRWGLSVSQISNTVQAAIKGISASKYRIGEDEYDITVRFSKDWRQNLNDLKNIIIFGKDDRMIPLSNIADIDLKPGFGSISHKSLKRMITIEADNKEGFNAFNIRKDVVSRINKIKKDFPRGYYFNMAGEDEEQKDAQIFLMKAFLWALFLIEIILIIQFN